MSGELSPLSPTQRRIADMVADGFTNKAICAKLSIGLRSFRTHMERIVAKLNLDATKDTRVQITWLVIDARYDEMQDYEAPIATDKKDAA